MKNILITNDDGIESDGLLRLARVAAEYGKIWIVAPDGERSASSHSITLHSEFEIHPYNYPIKGAAAYSCSGTPADCIRVGAVSIMPVKPDVVLSGINNGYNVATDLQYSGTAGAAFEGAFQGCLSVAFSEGYNGSHVITDKYLPEILSKILETNIGFGQIWNVNFPECSLKDFNGILGNRKVSHGMFYKDRYKTLEKLSDGGSIVKVDGTYTPFAEEGSDMQAILDNYISISLVNNIK
ncbi:MAG: 5'/3'-nucleotidase SurE [Eubacterium sp.]|nr:5'/3'-nucleotidase SurE [Eubacterium sp.]